MAQLTKNAILNSFTRLIEERSFDKIKVRDIVEDCGITRNAFYYHFQDMYAVVDELLAIETKRIINSASDDKNPEKSLFSAAGVAIGNKKALYHIYNSSRRDDVLRYFRNAIHTVMEYYVNKIAGDSPVSGQVRELTVSFCADAIYGAVLRWLDNPRGSDIDETLAQMDDLFGDSVKDVLQKGRAGS